ncbi:diguanylate cyclase [Patulibacter defluvii]|uniref:diguanylate cyclase n=1 Tax=Patulibacter defluvii TaxID=3095358 RepID=UPI002A755D52|nr:diguanylate cyclase [Patulibacter sp. DM4]
MSFRARLNLFFLLLVVVPLIAVGVVLLRTIDGAARGKVESALASEARAVSSLAREEQEQADGVSAQLARDRELAAALEKGDVAAVRARAAKLLSPTTDARRIRLTLRRGEGVVDVGSRTAILPAQHTLISPDDRQPLADLETSVAGPKAFVRRLTRLTGRQVQLREARDGRVVAGATVATGVIPGPGEVGATGEGGFTAVTIRQRGFGGQAQDVVLLASGAQAKASRADRLALVGTLILFLTLAAAGALAVSRSLQRQVGELLAGAQRLGRGEFDQEIAATGDDELAQLAEAFNAMSRQLRRRLDELHAERGRLRAAIRRIGETFAANLDREGLLEIVAQAAADGVRAEVGRARLTVEGRDEVALTGELDGLETVLDAAEARVLGGNDGLVSDGDLHALAVVMGTEGGLHGVVAVARREVPFTAADAEMVAYLSGQAAVSLENVGRHEEAEREAHTDALTGLANRRRFDELLAAAVDRAHRDGRPVSLLVLDLDRFKEINDQHGHQTGDQVLREVAWTLRSGVRGIDAPARLGGEEFGVILPATDAAGAITLAERLRIGVEQIRITTAAGRELRVTTSVGIGTVPGAAAESGELVALADGALYRAKREGRNRTITADASREQG